MADIEVSTAAQLFNALNGGGALSGDRVLVHGGYYQTTNAGTPSNQRVDGGFHFTRSGVTLMGYPGDTPPVLANRPLGSGTYFNFPTITFGTNNNNIIDGINVDGAIFMFCSGYLMTGTTLSGHNTGNIIRNCEIWEGWETPEDGNWSGIRVEGQTGALIQNCYIRDINALGNNTNRSSCCGIKIFTGVSSVYEYCVIDNVNAPDSQAASIDDKADSMFNEHRYNWFDRVQNGYRIQQQSSPGPGGGPSIAAPGQGTRFRHTVIIVNANNRGFTQEEGPLISYELSNCTIILTKGTVIAGSDDGMIYSADSTTDHSRPAAGAKAFNNIIYSTTAYRNMSAYSPSFGGGGRCDYNHYRDNTCPFSYDFGGQLTLAGWQALGFDQVGRVTTGDPNFVNLAGQNFHLNTGSVCINSGRTDGTPAGSPVNKGAYTDTVKAIGIGAMAPTGLVVS